ncbi:protein kinase [bacterium]|nr:protein kinase [bacterium]
MLVVRAKCLCGTPLEGTPSNAGALACTSCGRHVVVDADAAARATHVNDAEDTRDLAAAVQAAKAGAVSPLENSLGQEAKRKKTPVPDRLGAYRVLGRLGEGGIGVVYKGHDDILDRPVAIKVLAPMLRLDPDAVRRFLREARVAAGIAHENVVSIYFAGEENEAPYLVMEFVEGRDLRELLEREGPLPWKRAVKYMEDAARGLSAAQHRGLVHRDVKPANLLLDAKEDRVKVADFGLAKARSVDGSLTGSQILAGTPLYVAPEVAREGDGDHRADIYSLGATFYHLLAGGPPFPGKTPAAAIIGHLSEPVPDLASKRPDLPAGVVAIVRRCLAKEPKDRYATWPELLSALEQVKSGKPVEAAPEAALRPANGHVPRVVVRPVDPGPLRVHLHPTELPVRIRIHEDSNHEVWKTLGAYLLWVPPLGFLGFHRFFLGRTATGLIFFLTGGAFGIGWLIDLFSIPGLVKRSRQTGAATASDDGEALGTAYLLWILPMLGILGAHRYYTGHFFTGLLYTCTFGLFGIGWVLDFFLMHSLVQEARRPRPRAHVPALAHAAYQSWKTDE